MNRVGDYIRFAVWFSGIGYAVLCPIAGLPLSPGLHVLGMTSSFFVLICVALRPLRRKRGKPVPAATIHLRLGKRRKPAPPPRRNVPRRSHFGLRGAPH